jgi:hypothetical protein
VPPPPPPHNYDDVFRAYITTQANVTVATLHAQVVSILNIKSMIPVYLDNLSPHYNRWKTLFLNTLGKYELSDHVLTDIHPVVAADPHWRQMDCTVRSWLYGTIAPELIKIARRAQFVGNHETRALIVDVEFRNFVLGDLSISNYCRRLKGMVDALGDLREVVLDHSLILTTLRGLNGRFSRMAALVKRQCPFPIFAQVRNDL